MTIEMTSDISVPCASCTAPVGIAHAACSSCGARLPAELRASLLARLEAADEDYRDARERTRSASVLLLVVALLHLAVGVIYFMLQRSASMVETADSSAAALVASGQTLLAGVVLLGCFSWSRRSPEAGIGAGVVAWLGMLVLPVAISPATFFASFLSASGVGLLFAKLMVLVLLVRGLLAARAARAIVARRGG
jgi:hypothetical protein